MVGTAGFLPVDVGTGEASTEVNRPRVAMARAATVPADASRNRRVGGEPVTAGPMTLGLDAAPRYGITRHWAMPNSETFDVPPIAAFLERWHRPPSVDPFARNSEWATYRNDLSPETTARYHLDAVEFCAVLASDGVRAECVLFDPPYSAGQAVKTYQSVGIETPGHLGRFVRDGLDRLLVPGGIALSFGWNSAGFGRERGYDVLEILLVAHGGAHNDTICVAERKR